MANIKPEEGDHGMWQGYGLHTPTSASTHLPPFDANYAPGPLQLPYHGRPIPQKGNYRSLDIPSMQTRPPPRDGLSRDGNGIITASPPGLNSHSSFPSLKRSYTDDATYGQEFREEAPEMPKPTINQDNRLLSFTKLHDKHTVVDSHGRIQQLDMIAQIHGMFFLSEMTTPSSEGLLVQPELTCYRRNLFQISGTVTVPKGALSVITERGERVPVLSMDVTIAASESVDGHAVKLIVIPWKTPPPNSPEVGPGQEHEPTPIPLQPFDETGPDANSDFSVYPIVYRRLQFRVATANNGRRRELQQHFTLHLNVVATLANGAKTNVCETSTAPIVVRGRSPRNFQARKEIPLVGSSSSRGGPPDLHVATSIGSGGGPVSAPAGQQRPKTSGSRPQTMELPRSQFNFDSSHLPPSPAIMRTSTYPTYLSSQNNDQAHSTAPHTPGFQAPVGLDNYLHVSHSSAEINQSHVSTSVPRSQAPQHYTYQPVTSSPAQLAAPIKFVDNNPRPAKSPRHTAPPERNLTHPETSYPDYAARFAAPYNGTSDVLPPRDPGYFPSSLPLQQPWSSTSDTSGVYGTSMQAPSNLNEQYQYPGVSYTKDGSSNQQNYTWNPS